MFPVANFQLIRSELTLDWGHSEAWSDLFPTWLASGISAVRCAIVFLQARQKLSSHFFGSCDSSLNFRTSGCRSV